MKTIETAGNFKTGMLAKTKTRKGKLKAAAELGAVACGVAINDLLPSATIVIRAIDSLKPSKKLLRKSNSVHMKALSKSITQLGLRYPILISGDKIVDGNARLAAMKTLGETHIAAIDVTGLSPAQLDLLAIAVNRIPQLSEWDLDVLRDTVINLELSEISLDGTGFSDIELDLIKLDPIEGDAAALDELPEPAKVVTSIKGDLWELGNHRLLCGSALEADDYQVLMGSDTATAIITDPPYNIAVSTISGHGKVKHDEFVAASGEMSDEGYTAFLTISTLAARAHLVTAGVAIMFIDWRQVARLIGCATEAGYALINMAVWDKGSGGMGALYRSAHELVPVFCNGATTPLINNVKLGKHGRDRTNVWGYPGAGRPGSSAAAMSKDHPTPKSVEMIVDAMLDVTNQGDIVLDPFMGSGTTIIAAEECGRRARGLELDPKYVDLAVRRWESMTGQSAVLAGTGETFEQITLQRAAD